MSLTRRQTARFNAALCMLHDLGHDVSPITGEIRTLVGIGTPDASAFARALNRFVDANPSTAAPLRQITRLIDASDDRTVARYNIALDSYIATGDDSDLRSIAPNIARDMVELAARHGEPVPEIPPEIEAMMQAETATGDNTGDAAPHSAGGEPQLSISPIGSDQ